MKMIYDRKFHQPSGLRWFRFKTLLRILFQLEGFTLPPPFPGLCFGGSRVAVDSFFGPRFGSPFFTTWDPPESLSQVILAPKWFHVVFPNGVQNRLWIPTWLFVPLVSIFRFSYTTSSASRIAPAISKPHFPLSIFLLFLLSPWSAFG